MTYSEAIEYLYAQAPMFQQQGKKAYKTGLETTEALDAHFGHLHRDFATIHVAGTNGKGSTSHMIAAVLQKAGYKVGLYTSPHLKDFTERIRINGNNMDKQAVVHFVETNKELVESLNPSFFEITTAMAFKYFSDQDIDVAVVEVGLGGRLDCTNIIAPEISVITNISKDHTDLLGDDLESIAHEKAGVIKKGTPVVIGETQKEIQHVFYDKAREVEAPICYADQQNFGGLPKSDLIGEYQAKNKQTALTTLKLLSELGWRIESKHVVEGFKNVMSLTGMQGRWQQISDSPRVICDTAHNEAGLSYVVSQLKKQECDQLRMVFGVVSDKDVRHILPILPKNAKYYFVQAKIPRALDSKELQELAKEFGLKGECYKSIYEGLRNAKEEASVNDLIFVGGSNFTVAEIL